MSDVLNRILMFTPYDCLRCDFLPFGDRQTMFENNNKRSKKKIEVQLFLDDGSHLLAKLAVGMNERLSDLMNDERTFLPVETSQGHVIMFRKSAILKVVQLDQHVDAANVTDPYELLGVSRDVSNEELTQTYRMLCAENHPDKLQASGLSSLFVEMAHSRMARINDAYQRILASRQAPAHARTDEQPA